MEYKIAFLPVIVYFGGKQIYIIHSFNNLFKYEPILNRTQTTSNRFRSFPNVVENAHEQYPDLDFSINDEQMLVNDLSSTLEHALKVLFEPNHESDRLIPGWEYGFLLGYIEGNLNGHWVHEYIKKRSAEYKQIMILNAIKLYLKNDIK